MKICKYISLFLLLIAAFSGCTKVTPGYISDEIRYVDDTFRVPKGTYYSADWRSFQADGSSYPLSVKLLEIRDLATGKIATQFADSQNIWVFNELFNPDTDTTVELLNKKRTKQRVLPIQLMEKSGQLTLNEGTLNIPDGNYTFDISVSNERGTKTFKNISTIQLYLEQFQDQGKGCAWFKDNTTTSGDMGSPTMTCSKVSDDGYRVIVRITDKAGNPFNPKAGELIQRGDRPLFESYARFHPVQYTDTTMICDYEVTPFPMKEVPGYGYLMYYRIPSQFVTIDPGTAPTNDQVYSVNPRFAFRLLVPGTYMVNIKLPKVLRKTR
ncbi:uncharacterized protein DUF5007 [Chitinophaga dinghuensis]|uniref:Uncharacterized protein DUF5007 n=1 Tax=Chitinophaga dinghuensis TaxID=1539050 RepID=A0A327W0L1_9BACT|nr:DUF5007 domain-containing protein [Chitinophaga dinghuensis]RAJ81786.1 uncharacterized protein DUF5007 [Chitinophaga dinghuensis]